MAFQMTQRDLALLSRAVTAYRDLVKSLSESGPDEFSEFELRVMLSGHQCHIGYGDNGEPAVLSISTTRRVLDELTREAEDLGLYD